MHEYLNFTLLKYKMGKGDKKSKKGKRFRKSHGKIRPKNRNIVRRKVLAIENMTKWSIERLYSECGRYNRTTSIVFKDKSQSQTLFGQSITGEIFYTLEERRKLENRGKNGFVKESNGIVKFKIILKDELNPTQIKILVTEGFPSSDILFLDYYPLPLINEFQSKGVRKLPEPKL